MEDKRERYQFDRVQFNMPTPIHIGAHDKCTIEVVSDREGFLRLARLIIVKDEPHIRTEYNFERRKIIVTDLDFNISFKRYLKGRWERLKLLFR